jgi:hypothetical protein
MVGVMLVACSRATSGGAFSGEASSRCRVASKAATCRRLSGPAVRWRPARGKRFASGRLRKSVSVPSGQRASGLVFLAFAANLGLKGLWSQVAASKLLAVQIEGGRVWRVAA